MPQAKSLEDFRNEIIGTQPVVPTTTTTQQSKSLDDFRNKILRPEVQEPTQPKANVGGFIQNFLVDSVSDVGAVLGGVGGAAFGGGVGAIPGAVAGAGLGTMAEQGLRLLLGMTPQEQLVAAAEDPVLNDLVNTLGFDLIGGLAVKGGIKAAKAVGQAATKKVGTATAKALSQVDANAVEAATKLADNGIVLDSTIALEGNVPETLTRLAKPDDLEKVRQRVIASNAEVIKKITGAEAKNLTAEKSFQRGQEVIAETTKAVEKVTSDVTSREAAEQLDVLTARAKELQELAKKPSGMAPVQDAAYKKAVQEETKEVAQKILETSKKVSPEFDKLSKALNVDTLQAIATGKKTPLAKNVIKSVVAHPERIDAALAINRKLKPILRDELLTQLGEKSNKVAFLETNKQSFEKVLPAKFYKNGETSYTLLNKVYTAMSSSTADKIVPNYGSAWIGTRGAQTLMWFGRNAVRSGVISAGALLGGDVTGGVLVTLGSKSFAKRVLLNPEFSQIVIKAAEKKPLTTPELKKLMAGIAGTRVVINNINKDGNKVGKGKEIILEERTSFAPRQVQR